MLLVIGPYTVIIRHIAVVTLLNQEITNNFEYLPATNKKPERVTDGFAEYNLKFFEASYTKYTVDTKARRVYRRALVIIHISDGSKITIPCFNNEDAEDMHGTILGAISGDNHHCRIILDVHDLEPIYDAPK